MYSVGLTRRDGNVDGWVFDLPGCRAIGSSVEEVTSLLPVAIGDHAAWLKSRGLAAPADASFEFKVVEDVTSNAEFCFEADRAPLSQEDVDAGIAQISAAHADLRALVGSLPDVVLDWKPPASAVKIELYPDVRSIRDMAAHAASAMTFHLRGVSDLTTRIPDPENVTLVSALMTVLSRLRALNAEERAGTAYKSSGPRGEAEWSARKSVRRIVNHLRFHAREAQQRLCWLSLGVPEVLPPSRE